LVSDVDAAVASQDRGILIVVTDGDSQGVCNIRRFRSFVEAKLSANRVLYLYLGGPTAARQHSFDLGRSETLERNSSLAGSQADDASSMSHQDRGSRTFVVREEFF
jgi:hypothetical protein